MPLSLLERIIQVGREEEDRRRNHNSLSIHFLHCCHVIVPHTACGFQTHGHHMLSSLLCCRRYGLSSLDINRSGKKTGQSFKHLPGNCLLMVSLLCFAEWATSTCHIFFASPLFDKFATILYGRNMFLPFCHIFIFCSIRPCTSGAPGSAGGSAGLQKGRSAAL